MKRLLLLVCVLFAFSVPAQSQEYWTCSLDGIGATLTLCKAAPGPEVSLYISQIVATSTTATAGLMLLQYGTGANCGTGTTSLLPSAASVVRIAYPGSGAGYPMLTTFLYPLRVPAGKDVCVLGTATNTVTIQMWGYVR